MFKKFLRILIILTLFAWIGGYGAFVLHITKLAPQQPNKKTDAIIVLTGGKKRIHKGLELFQKKRAEHLFITGVNESVSKNDITKMWKEQYKLPDCCITLGHEATTTLENAIETKNWIETNKISSIQLVTSAYHIDRALLEFHYLIKGIEIISHPLDVHDPPANDIKFWKITFSEYNKIIFRWLAISLINKG